jgi:putative acetyltransferase
MHPDRHFRWASAADDDVLADIMYDAVRNGDSRYSEQQRAAWVPARRSGEDWIARLRSQDIIVAEQDGAAVGFLSLAEGGYLDFAYIRPEAQHSGLLRQLFSRIVERAVARGERLLWTHASLMAEPAFAKLGFTIRKRERVRIGDQDFERCEMERHRYKPGSFPASPKAPSGALRQQRDLTQTAAG